MKPMTCQRLRCAVLLLIAVVISASASAMERIEGTVIGGGKPIAMADVTVWVAGPGTPQKLAETQAKDNGSFELTIAGNKGSEGVLYIIAKAPNPSITMMADRLSQCGHH